MITARILLLLVVEADHAVAERHLATRNRVNLNAVSSENKHTKGYKLMC
jgi:hypothetical protein